MQSLQSFVKFDKSTDLVKIHQTIGSDLDLSAIYVQFSDLSEPHDAKDLSLHELIKFLTLADQFTHFREITIILSRIAGCTPHSADVERCVCQQFTNNFIAIQTEIRNRKQVSIYPFQHA
jgi:hypothetical protein